MSLKVSVSHFSGGQEEEVTDKAAFGPTNFLVLKKQKDERGRCVCRHQSSCEQAIGSKLHPVSGNTGRMPLVHLYLNGTRAV